MLGRLMFPLLLGLGGVVILLALGFWQLDRLAEKEAYLAQIDARIGAEAVDLPATPDPERDRFLAVRLDGRITGGPLRVLASTKDLGAVYREIVAFETDGRTILVDLGVDQIDDPTPVLPTGQLAITGNLHWPDETDGWTPEPDGELWFARDVDAMAAALRTEQVMVVLRSSDSPALPVTPMPIDSSLIPNDHLEYAITWFSLAAVWLVMSLFLIVRTRRTGPQDGPNS
jgi:surfeit locus 1 family protein